MSGISEQRDGRCATADVDLELLSGAYRFREPTAEAIAHADAAAADLPSGSWVLDIGGGPGHHAARFAEKGLRPVVVDPTPGMLAQASVHAGVSVAAATAQALPFAARVVTLAYFHLSIHYGDWRGALREAIRVLAPGGRCVIWTLGPDHHASSNLFQWFPSVYAIDEDRFPDPASLADALSTGAVVTTGREVEEKTRRVGDWESAVRNRFVSTLQLVSADEMDDGLQRFRREHPDPNATFAYDLKWDWIVAETVPLR